MEKLHSFGTLNENYLEFRSKAKGIPKEVYQDETHTYMIYSGCLLCNASEDNFITEPTYYGPGKSRPTEREIISCSKCGRMVSFKHLDKSKEKKSQEKFEKYLKEVRQKQPINW